MGILDSRFRGNDAYYQRLKDPSSVDIDTEQVFSASWGIMGALPKKRGQPFEHPAPPFPPGILVDDLDGVAYKAYGSVPAGVFIVDEDGNLAFKDRVVEASDVDEALQDLM